MGHAHRPGPSRRDAAARQHGRTWAASHRKHGADRREYTRRRRAGQSLVEFALILPILMILVLAAVDLGRMYYAQIAIRGAAREGVMEAMRDPSAFIPNTACTSENQGTNRVMCRTINEARGSFAEVNPSDVTLSCSPTGCARALGTQVTVDVRGTFQLITPLLAAFTGGQTVTLRAAASGEVIVLPQTTAVVLPTPTPTPPPTADPTAQPTAQPTATPAPTAAPTPTPTATPCPPPAATIDANPVSGKKKKTVFTFTGPSAPAGCAVTWSWSFGDGSGGSSGQTAIYTYQSAGTYTVTLTVSIQNGSSATGTRSITVTP